MLQYLDLFLENMVAERACSRNTLEAYRRDLRDYSEYISAYNISDLLATRDNIDEFVLYLSKSGISARSVARKLSALRGYYKFLITESIISHNPVLLIDSPRIGKSLPRYITIEEVKQLMIHLDKDISSEGIRLKAMISMMYSSGMRVSELVSLRIDNIMLLISEIVKGNIANASYQFMIISKGEKERIVFINNKAFLALKEYLQDVGALSIMPSDIAERVKWNTEFRNKYLFPSPYETANLHMTRQNFALLLKKASFAAGLDGGKISPHVLRHTFASTLISKGADLKIIQELLGHSDIGTTQIYTHLEKQHIQKALETSHPLSLGAIK